MNERAQLLLRTLIERYVAEGQPVGSKTLSQHAGLDVSPATIRNIMADLEDHGFIASPHTSAGRIPTARGYRFFVDALLAARPMVREQNLPAELPSDTPQHSIEAASQLLSQLTCFAGVVLTPRRQELSLRHVEFLPLSDKRVLLILVTSDGSVQNRILHTERNYSAVELLEAGNFLTLHASGRTLAELVVLVQHELLRLKGDIVALMNAAVEVGSSTATGGETVLVSGELQLLGISELSANVGRVRQLLELFEQKTALLQLLDQGSRADGVQIYIGGESGLAPLDECSVVTAPYHVDGAVVGTLGVIGPTRMAYDRVIPIVDITARLLSSALTLQSKQ
ncbi:heat-inducible transcriptional repressor HrcA [Chitinilyticum piscinae]|nr:heat-inducible transcriptional repressor HrcA [Chitinilyticum piscinae]